MQVTRRALLPGEIDHELIWLSVSLGSLAFAFAWFVLGLPWPHCWFHDVTGLPCVTCGATRSTIEFFHAHFAAAIKWNPLAFAFLCALTIYDVYALAVLATRAPRVRFTFLSVFDRKFARLFLIAALVLNWIYLLNHRQALA